MSVHDDLKKTLAYFSYFKYPLTTFELWKWQYRPSQVWAYSEIVHAVGATPGGRPFDGACEHQGMYAIGSADDVREQVEERHRRYRNSIRKEKKLRSVLRLLSRLKDVRGVAICNSLPFHFTESRSDIDLFVITRSGRLWATRFACVLPLMLLRQRPGEAKDDPVDISFFASEAKLKLEELRIKPHDPYMAFWVKTLTPVLGSSKLWARFFKENSWANMYLPNARIPVRSAAVRQRSRRQWIPSISESLAARLQERRLPEDLRAMANQDSRVVISDSVLKFHKNDRRAEICDHFERVCSA